MCNCNYYRPVLKYLDHTSLLLDGTVKALSIPPPGSQTLLARQSHICQHKQERKKNYIITSAAKGIPYVTNKDGILAPGLLPYVIEGFLPTLKVQ